MAPLDSASPASASASRDPGGRFRPGQSGNPRGRPLGSLNRATRLRAWLEDGEERANARVVIDRALGGDLVAARCLMDRLDPKPRTRPLPLALGPDTDIDAVYEAAFHAMAAGEIAPEEALAVGRFLDQLRESRAKSAAEQARAQEAQHAALAERNATLARENEALRARLAALEAAIETAAATQVVPPAVEPPVAAPAASDDLYSASIIRPTKPADGPPLAAQPTDAAALRKRKRARRYWAGKPPPGYLEAGVRMRGVQDRRYDSSRGIRAA